MQFANSAVILEAEGEGIDTLYVTGVTQVDLNGPVPPSWPRLQDNVENLVVAASTRFVTAPAVWYGNDLDNVMTSARASGGEQAHTFHGLAGNDTYVLDGELDLAVEARNAGIDTVIASVNHRLGDNIENLTLNSTRDGLRGEGNGLANTITGSTGGDTLDGRAGADVMIGGRGIDTLFGGDGNDTLFGGSGNDRLVGDAGLDRLEGGAGNDTYVLGAGADTIVEVAGGGIDTVESDRSFVLAAHVENLTLTGAAGLIGVGNSEANTLRGTAGNDSLRGMDGNDLIFGNDGDDAIDGGTGNDRMVGGAGNDSFYVDSAADVVIEFAGGGNDTVFSSVSYVLQPEIETLILLGSVGLSGRGNDLDNRLVGTTGDDTLNGGLGADRLEGRGGNDRYVIDNAGDVIVEQAGGGTDTVESSVNYTLGSHLENLVLVSAAAIGAAGLTGTGNALDNEITGSRATDTLFGGAGNDTLNGGDSNDLMHGGLGNDTYVFSGTGDQVVEAANGGIDTVLSSHHLTVLAPNVENLIFSPTRAPVAGGAQATGNALNNTMTSIGVRTVFFGLGGNDTLTGGAGDDTLYGGDGDDVLDGGGGVNTLFGGGGDDLYIISRSQQVVDERVNFNDAGGVDQVRASISFNLAFANFVENLELVGSAGLRGDGNGMDNRIGGTAQRDTLSGLIGDDTLLGRGGDDVLNGGAGSDRMVGGVGDDSYFVDNALDQVIENAGEGIDTVNATVAFTLAAHVENLIMSASPSLSNATGQGNALNNTLTRASGFGTLIGLDGDDTLIGAGGRDTLIGGLGNDTMIGGGGDDRYAVEQYGDVVIEAAGGGYDWVTSVISYTLTDHVERLTLLSGAIGLTGTGNGLANLIEGTVFGDTLFGGGGDDTIRGGNGGDTIIGDVSQNVLLDGQGDDDLIAFAPRDLDQVMIFTPNITVLGGSGFDTLDLTNLDREGRLIDMAAQTVSIPGLVISGIEAIIAGAGDDTIVNARNAVGGDGRDSLSGTAGADILSGGAGNDTLDGGLGADILVGGTGDDTFFVDRAGDIVEELANGGTDTVRSTVSYTLSDDPTTGHVENLVLLGAAGLIGTGNRLNNTLTGTNQGDTLRGGGGNDTLIGLNGVNFLFGGAGGDRLEGGDDTDSLDGGAGADILIGGLGSDLYAVDNVGDVVIEAAGGGELDRVTTALASYTLDAHVEQLVGTRAAGAALTGNAANNFIVGAGGGDTLSGLDGDDNLQGGDGNDTLFGGNGADTMRGEGGDDTMAGGDGDDFYLVDSAPDQVIELAGGGTDSVNGALSAYTLAANVENLTSTFTGGSLLFGNAENNLITSSSGNDTIHGQDGHDILVGDAGNDTLYGGAGNDTLIDRSFFGTHSDMDTLFGGLGDDTYVYSSVGTVIIEAENEGIDTVFTSLPSYVLGQNIENVIAFTSANATLVGNALDNSMTGGGEATIPWWVARAATR